MALALGSLSYAWSFSSYTRSFEGWGAAVGRSVLQIGRLFHISSFIFSPISFKIFQVIITRWLGFKRPIVNTRDASKLAYGELPKLKML